MNISRLEYFVAVAQETNLARAAARLYISRSALSQQIRKLEDEVGHPLVDRSSRRVALTAAGRALLPRARELVDLAHRIPAVVDEAARGTREVLRVGANSSSLLGVIPALLAAHRRQAPDVTVLVDEQWDEQQLEMLRAGELDAAVFRSVEAPEDLDCTSFAADALHVCLPSDHPLAVQDTVDWTQLRGERLLLPDRRLARIEVDTVLAAFTANGVHLEDAVLQMQGYHGPAWVASGFGIVVVPGYATALKLDGTVFRPLHPAHPAMQLRLAVRREPRSWALTSFVRTASSFAARAEDERRFT